MLEMRAVMRGDLRKSPEDGRFMPNAAQPKALERGRDQGRRGWASGVLLLLVAGLAAAEEARPFRVEKLAEMDAAINQAIADKKCPGGVLGFEHEGKVYHKAYGNRAIVPEVEPMTEDTIFDAASLTKVVACTPAMMLLIERGQVKLDEPAQTYIPEFKGDGKEAITVRQLMTHTSGLRPDIETKTDWHGQQTAIQKACEEKLQAPPGTVFRYRSEEHTSELQ